MFRKMLTRREVFKLAFLSFGSLFLLRTWRRTSFAQTAKGLLAESDQIATALIYRHDATKAPADKRIKKGNTEGKDQFCDNCNFYKSAGNLNGGPVGECTLIPAGLVKAKGWCMSWFQKVG